MKKSSLALLVVLGICAASVRAEYHLVKEIPVGGNGGWDYLSIDESAHRLYMSHATKVVVIDLKKDKVIGEIADTPGVHGIAIGNDVGRGFISDGRTNKVTVFDLKSLKTLTTVATGEGPDAILYEPGRSEVYAFNGHGKSATVIDGKTSAVVATIDLGGKPEFAAADAKAGRVYCNLEDKSEVAVIDTATHTVTVKWPIAPGESASGMAFDLEHHRLFLGCDNKMVAMMDSVSGKILGTDAIGSGVDANAFDPKAQLVFSSCGDGTTTIAQVDAAGKLATVQSLKTQRGSKTMALDTATRKIYLGAADFEAKAAPGQRRPKMLPGSFKVLVFAPGK